MYCKGTWSWAGQNFCLVKKFQLCSYWQMNCDAEVYNRCLTIFVIIIIILELSPNLFYCLL